MSRIDASLCFARSVYDELEVAVRTLLESTSGASASELKDAMGLTRKYAMPLLEFMDDRGVTVREGDARRFARGDPAADRFERDAHCAFSVDDASAVILLKLPLTAAIRR